MSSSSHPIVLTSSPDGPITAFDGISGVPLCHFSGSRSPSHGLALVGNSFIAASHISPVTASASIHLYNWWSSTPLHNLLVPEPVAPLSSTPDGFYLFAGGLSGCIYTLSVPSGDILSSYSAHNKPVSYLKISEDGSLLISGGDDGTISYAPIFQIVDASPDYRSSTDLMFKRFVAHDGSVTAIEYSNNSTTILSCSLDCTVKIWGLLDGTKLRTVTLPCPIMGLALDQVGKEFYAAGSDGFIYKGSTVNVGRQKHDEFMTKWGEKHESGIVCLVMMTVSERKSLVSAAEDGKVYVWEIETGEATMGFGNDMGSNISYMVVANGMGQGLKVDGKLTENLSDGLLCRRVEVNRSLNESLELEDAVRVAANDRSRAIDMLESAISVYEKLLELILKEAKKGHGSTKSGKPYQI